MRGPLGPTRGKPSPRPAGIRRHSQYRKPAKLWTRRRELFSGSRPKCLANRHLQGVLKSACRSLEFPLQPANVGDSPAADRPKPGLQHLEHTPLRSAARILSRPIDFSAASRSFAAVILRAVAWSIAAWAASISTRAPSVSSEQWPMSPLGPGCRVSACSFAVSSRAAAWSVSARAAGSRRRAAKRAAPGPFGGLPYDQPCLAETIYPPFHNSPDYQIEKNLTPPQDGSLRFF